MKTLILILLFLVIAASSVQAQTRTQLQPERLFNSNSTVKEWEGQKTGESGTLNGVAYEIHYSDGSARFSGKPGSELDQLVGTDDVWRIGCDKDAMDDSVSCSIRRRDLHVLVTDNGRSMITVGRNHVPRSLVALRIDKGSPIVSADRLITGSFTFAESEQIIKRLSQAKTLTTRFELWPSGAQKDDVWDSLFGFNEALAYVRWAVTRIK